MNWIRLHFETESKIPYCKFYGKSQRFLKVNSMWKLQIIVAIIKEKSNGKSSSFCGSFVDLRIKIQLNEIKYEEIDEKEQMANWLKCVWKRKRTLDCKCEFQNQANFCAIKKCISCDFINFIWIEWIHSLCNEYVRDRRNHWKANKNAGSVFFL